MEKALRRKDELIADHAALIEELEETVATLATAASKNAATESSSDDPVAKCCPQCVSYKVRVNSL